MSWHEGHIWKGAIDTGGDYLCYQYIVKYRGQLERIEECDWRKVFMPSNARFIEKWAYPLCSQVYYDPIKTLVIEFDNEPLKSEKSEESCDNEISAEVDEAIIISAENEKEDIMEEMNENFVKSKKICVNSIHNRMGSPELEYLNTQKQLTEENKGIKESKKQAKQQAIKEAEEKAKKEAEEKARKEAEEKARKEAEEKARQEAEEKARL
ncbi:t-richoplein keratin filament-binding protein, putative, partial [Entamoeba histolytica KU27]